MTQFEGQRSVRKSYKNEVSIPDIVNFELLLYSQFNTTIYLSKPIHPTQFLYMTFQ